MGLVAIKYYVRDLWGNEVERVAYADAAEITGPPRCHECDAVMDDGSDILCQSCSFDAADEKPSDGWHEQNERLDP